MIKIKEFLLSLNLCSLIRARELEELEIRRRIEDIQKYGHVKLIGNNVENVTEAKHHKHRVGRIKIIILSFVKTDSRIDMNLFTHQ